MAYQRQNWQVNESGILRKKEETEEELLVFGYACKLFRDDEKALYVDQGKHLIPWMGNDALKIDRYDVRGAVFDLSQYEAHQEDPFWFNLSQDELRIEQMCDEERYRALTHNEDEEALYQEEELKRLHQALGNDKEYGQVSYKYDEDDTNDKNGDEEKSAADSNQKEEIDEPFKPPVELDIPQGMVLPESVKLNAIIEKTAMFIDRQGSQMEIVLKIKQAGNPQFNFLSINAPLHPYYRYLLSAIKSGRYKPVIPTTTPATTSGADGSNDQSENLQNNYYLHSSLVPPSSAVDVAPVIPTINYKPSADCAYSMLVNRIKGNQNRFLAETPSISKEDGDESNSCDGISLKKVGSSDKEVESVVTTRRTSLEEEEGEDKNSLPRSVKPPKRRRRKRPQGACAYYDPIEQDELEQYSEEPSTVAGPLTEEETVMYCEPPPTSLLQPEVPEVTSSMSNPSPPPIVVVDIPPADLQLIIDKMASYVAKNGRDFESIVRSKGDPRFYFLNANNQYHQYYCKQVEHYEGLAKPPPVVVKPSVVGDVVKEQLQQQSGAVNQEVVAAVVVEENNHQLDDNNSCDSFKKESSCDSSSLKSEMRKTTSTSLSKPIPVCFSIKKPKESEGLEIRSALPVEESDDDGGEEGEGEEEKEKEKELGNDEEKGRGSSKSGNVEEGVVDVGKVVDKEKWADERVKDKLASVAREKLVVKEREKQLQLERKRRAAAFLNLIHKHKDVQPVIGPQLPPGMQADASDASVSTPPSTISSSPERDQSKIVPTIEIEDSPEESVTNSGATSRRKSTSSRPSIASAKAYMEYYKASESKRMRSELEMLKRRRRKKSGESSERKSRSRTEHNSGLTKRSASGRKRRKRRSSREDAHQHHRKHKHRRRTSESGTGDKGGGEEERSSSRHKRKKTYKAKKHKRKEVKKSESSSSSSSSDSD